MLFPHLPKLFALTGDGGAFFSTGFIAWANSIHGKLAEVDIRYDSGRNTTDICAAVVKEDPSRRIALVGYSLGGNGCAWVADTMFKLAPQRKIDLIVAVDPTRNGPPMSNYPIRSNVVRVKLFKQVSLLSPLNWFFGRGELVASLGGPNIDTTEVHSDHVYLQYSNVWMEPTNNALGTLRSERA